LPFRDRTLTPAGSLSARSRFDVQNPTFTGATITLLSTIEDAPAAQAAD
jgi:hypothetical protein